MPTISTNNTADGVGVAANGTHLNTATCYNGEYRVSQTTGTTDNFAEFGINEAAPGTASATITRTVVASQILGTTCGGPGQLLGFNWTVTYKLVTDTGTTVLRSTTDDERIFIHEIITDPGDGSVVCEFLQTTKDAVFAPINIVTTGSSDGSITINGIPVGGTFSPMSTDGNAFGTGYTTIEYDESFDQDDDDDKECPYLDPRWLSDCFITGNVSNISPGGFYKATGDKFRNKNFWLCSADNLRVGSGLEPSHAVLLKTRDDRFYLTTCKRINFGRFNKPTCNSDICKALAYLFCGEKTKDKASKGLDPVSIGIIVSSTNTKALVNSQIGTIFIDNEWGTQLLPDREVVIFNADPPENNFVLVLGPTEKQFNETGSN